MGCESVLDEDLCKASLSNSTTRVWLSSKVPTFYHDTAVPFRHSQQPPEQPSSSDFPRFTTWSILPKRRFAPKSLKKETLKASSRNDDRWVTSLFELKKYIGFAWNKQEAAWDNDLEDLKRFKAKEGHCKVPLIYSDSPKLRVWVQEQRRHYALIKQEKQDSRTTEDRAKALDAIGFCWNHHEAVWGEFLQELCNFKEEHGHCSVPMDDLSNPKLAYWVRYQRLQYKKTRECKKNYITEDRIRALECIGSIWAPREKASPYERPENKH